MFWRIRISLTLWYVAVLLGILAVIGAVTYAAFSRSLSDEVDESLKSSAQAVAGQIDEDALESLERGREEAGDDDEERGLRFFSPSAGDTFYLLLSPTGTVIADPSNATGEGIPDVSAAQEAATRGEDWSTAKADGSSVRTYSLAIRHDGETLAVVQVGRSLEEHERQLTGLLAVLGASGGLGLALAAAGGLVVAARALRPVKQAYERQRSFVADASHELRTPLTIIRGNAEMLGLTHGPELPPEAQQELGDIVGQAAYMEQLVAGLSLLARIDEGNLPLRREPVDAGELVHHLGRSARTLGAAKQLEVMVETNGDLRLVSDPVRLQEILMALAENAVRHTPPGGRVSFSAARRDQRLVIQVADSGPGIEPSERERIFDRFYRTDEARSRETGGTGLGLAIARSLAQALGGRLAAGEAPGGGALFTLELPA